MVNKQLLKTFKAILLDAAKTFNRAPYQVTTAQWNYVARGRMTQSSIRLFGFALLRNAIAPAPDTTKREQAEARALIERLVSGA